MKPAKASLYFHPIFIISLALLLGNDFFWKQLYGNWLTGKLSDAAGLIVMSIFLLEVSPRIGRFIAIFITAVFFCWWKSSFSQPLIDFCNSYLQVSVQRVIDYTDLLMLPVLLVVWFMQSVALINCKRLIQPLYYIIGAVTVCSLCATSRSYREIYASQGLGNLDIHEEITLKKSEQEILFSLKEKGIIVQRDSITYHPVVAREGLYYRRVDQTDSSVVWQQLPADTTIYLKREHRALYLIPAFDMDKIRLRNIRFEISSNKKGTKSTIHVRGFQTNLYHAYYMDKKTQESHKKLLQEIFKE